MPDRWRMPLAGLSLALGGLILLAATPDESTGAPALPPSPPPLPTAASPVEAFRRLLALPEAEQARSLASKDERRRLYLRDCLREFGQLGPPEREVRLRLLELQWQLIRLITLPPTNRVEQLRAVPEPLRALVEERLAYWDGLAPEHQQELLANATALQPFPWFRTRPEAERGPPVPDGLPPEQRKSLETESNRWRDLPEGQRRRIAANMERLFSLSDRSKAHRLRELSDAERLQVARLLTNFAGLSPEERALCLESFGRFANMSDAERRHFLKNAARWKAMSAQEQASWRALMANLPPVPPGFDTSVPVPPPVPRLPKSSPPEETNAHGSSD